MEWCKTFHEMEAVIGYHWLSGKVFLSNAHPSSSLARDYMAISCAVILLTDVWMNKTMPFCLQVDSIHYEMRFLCHAQKNKARMVA